MAKKVEWERQLADFYLSVDGKFGIYPSSVKSNSKELFLFGVVEEEEEEEEEVEELLLDHRLPSVRVAKQYVQILVDNNEQTFGEE